MTTRLEVTGDTPPVPRPDCSRLPPPNSLVGERDPDLLSRDGFQKTREVVTDVFIHAEKGNPGTCNDRRMSSSYAQSIAGPGLLYLLIDLIRHAIELFHLFEKICP